LGATGFEPVASKSQPKIGKQVTQNVEIPLAHSLARESQKCPALAPLTSPPADPIDADLARLVSAWPNLPAAIRRGILAMIDAARKEG
jgi:hypothetical protein